MTQDDPSRHVREAGLDAPTEADLARLVPGLEVHRHRRVTANGPPVEVVLLLKPTAAALAQRLIDISVAALDRFDDWYGPYPYDRLVVVDAPWNSRLVGASYPRVVVLATRWRELPADRSLERRLVAGIARQYWFDIASADRTQGWFEEGMVLYSSTRAIQEDLEGRRAPTPRYFGGFIPYTIRDEALSPGPMDSRLGLSAFPEVEEPAAAPWRAWTADPDREAGRTARALLTLERYIGWPALQQALAAFRGRVRARHPSPSELAAIVSEQRGVDLGWFFSEAFRFGARFDYGIDQFTSEPVIGEPSTYQTRLVLRRYGDAVFAGTARPRGGGDRAQSVPVRVVFGDGTKVREGWDGRDASYELSYQSRSRAVSASVDPDAILLLDENRANNTRMLTSPFSAMGARLALHWLMWLQDAFLATSGLV